MSLLVNRTEPHAARASYKPEWFLRSLIIPQNSSSEVELPPQRQSRTELHFLPASLFFTCLTVFSCGWKPSVWAHPGSLEETLLCEACESEEGHFHQVLHPVSSEATARCVCCVHTVDCAWMIPQSDGSLWREALVVGIIPLIKY